MLTPIRDHDELLLELLRLTQGRNGRRKKLGFDLGGVFDRYDFTACNREFARLASVPIAHVQAAFAREPRRRNFCTGSLSSEDFVRDVLAEIDLELPRDEYDRITAQSHLGLSRTIGVLPVLRPHVETLFMFTDNNPWHWAYCIESFPQLFAQFDQVWWSHLVGHMKGELACMDFLKGQLGDMRDVIFVDDKLSIVQWFNAHGATGVFYTCQ